jgi:hypothetical protein
LNPLFTIADVTQFECGGEKAGFLKFRIRDALEDREKCTLKIRESSPKLVEILQSSPVVVRLPSLALPA